jgi:hypothetical protein
MSRSDITRGAALAGALLATGVGAVGVATAGPPASDTAGNFATLDVDVNPPQASTKAVKRGVSLDLHYFAGNNRTGARSPYKGDITVRLPRGMASNGATFPSKCPLPATTDQLGDETRCPAAAKVGTGSAELDARPAIQAPIAATVNAYNGALHGKRSTMVVMIATTGANPMRDELDLEYSSDPVGPYGYKLGTIHPVVDPSAGFVTIRQLDLSVPDVTTKKKVGAKKVKIHLLDAPTKCARTWEFAQIVATQAGDGRLTATDSVGCVSAP